MQAKDYVKLALRTEGGKNVSRVEHAVMGLVTEAGELMSAVKKNKIYGKELDRTNLLEEAGDIM